MTPAPDRWARAQEIFHAVADLGQAEREQALSRACGDDELLRAQIESLLAADSEASLLDRGISAVAGRVLADGRPSVPATPFGPYRATRLIGEGGMGVVYHAVRDDLGSEAAIKVLRDAWLSPARRERFLAEQRTLSHLNHPSIARLFDAGALADGTPWIAMEFVEGDNLSSYCRDHRVGVRERLELVRAICEAAGHAHRHLVIHRDLKPSNVLVQEDGRVKLLDFGIAKQLRELEEPADATRTGLRLMTPAYAAPEQIAGGRVGVHTDVYALGVMTYELLSGQLPFDVANRSSSEVERLISEAPVPRPSVHAVSRTHASAAEWADLDVLCATAMHRDVARRYPSVEAFARDIDHFLAGEPLDARGDSWGYRASKFLHRHRARVAAASALTLTAAGATAYYTVNLAQARDTAVTAQARAERIQRFMTGLFQGGDAAAGPADSLRVVTLLEQGAREARGLDKEPRVQADLYHTLGGIYRQLGRLERADSMLSQAHRQWVSLAGQASVEAARAAVALGDLRTDQARYDDALRLQRAAIGSLRAAAPPQPSAEGEAMVAIGRTFVERGDHHAAIAILDSAARHLATVDPEGPDHIAALSELANAQFYAGRYDAADSVNRVVLALTRRRYGERHPLVAEDLMNLGATEQERGHYKESEALFREAIALSTEFYGENHHKTAGNVVYLGRSLLLQNRYPEARAAFERGLGIRERVYGSNHPVVANSLNELGALAMRENRYEDARAAFERVRRIYQAAYPGRNFRVGVASGNLGDVYLNRKDYPNAERLYRDAVEHFVASQGPDHLNTGVGYIKLGRCVMRAGRFREAEGYTQRGYAVVSKVAAPDVSFLQAARLDLSIMYDSLGQPARAEQYRQERAKYLPRPK